MFVGRRDIRDAPLFRDAGRGCTGRGRGVQRGGRSWRGGRGRTGGRGAANLAVAEETQHTEARGDAEYSELEELRRFKLQVENSKGKGLATQEPADTTSWFGNFAGYAHMGIGIHALASTKPHV